MTKYRPQSAPLLESHRGMRLSDVFHGNTTAERARDRQGQWLDTYVTLKPPLALILLHVAGIAPHREDNVGN